MWLRRLLLVPGIVLITSSCTKRSWGFRTTRPNTPSGAVGSPSDLFSCAGTPPASTLFGGPWNITLVTHPKPGFGAHYDRWDICPDPRSDAPS